MIKNLFTLLLLFSSFPAKDIHIKADHTFEDKVEQVTDTIKRTYKVSHYGHGDGFHGKLMANGEVMNKHKLTAASPLIKGTNKPKYKLGTRLLVINPKNGKSVEVVITDTGGFRKKGRELDLSYNAFSRLGNPDKGLILVEIEIINDKL